MSTPLATTESVSTCAPLTGWRRMAADTLMVGGATLVCHALGAVTSLLLRGLLDPAMMGVWQGLKTFLSYGNYTNLGISKGATQELAIARGRGDIDSARRGLNLAHTVNTLTSLAYAAALWIAAAWLALRGTGVWSQAWALGLAAIGLLAMLQRHVTFQVTILRAKQAFAATSRLSLLEASLTLIASALAIWLCGLTGVYVATAIVLAASWWYVGRCGAERLGWCWDLAEIRRLVCIGGPILLAGVASSLFRSLDKLMILGYLDDREYQLGCYSLALMVGSQLYGLANMLSTVMGPRYSELLGHSRAPREVARLAARASEVQAAAIALPAALALVAAPPMLRWLLPEYEAGLAPLLRLVPGLLAVSMALPASQFLIAINQGGRVVVALLAATGIAAVGNHLVLTRGGSLEGVATVMSVSNLAYLAILVCMSLWKHLTARERTRYVAMLILCIGSNAALAMFASQAIDTRDSESLIAASMAIVAAWMTVLAAAWHFAGWSNAWRLGRD